MSKRVKQANQKQRQNNQRRTANHESESAQPQPKSNPNEYTITELHSLIGNQSVQRLLQQGSPKLTIQRVQRAEPTFHITPKHVARAENGSGKSLQRDLDGTSKALSHISVGGAKKSLWSKLIESVSQYEQAEKLIRANNYPGGQAKGMQALLELITGIRKLGLKWQSKHKKEVKKERWAYAEEMKTIRENKGRAELGDSLKPVQPEGKKSRQAGGIHSLFVRLNVEEKALRNQTWLQQGDPMSDTNLKPGYQDNKVGGALNKLDYGTWSLNGKNKTGYYQKEKTADPTIPNTAGEPIGIPEFDPNFAARSVAMGRIDALITEKINEVAAARNLPKDPKMLVNMEFASHERETHKDSGETESTIGVALESAKGDEMRKHFLAGGHASMANKSPGTIALNDPVLQRGLNKLQILDAICGQVDRHMANVFIDTDKSGNVTGVQGIDNDLAFGAQHTSFDDKKMNKKLSGAAWRGLPPFADELVAVALENITPQMIEDALEGLLKPDEIQATVKRFKEVKDFVDKLPQHKRIKHRDWVRYKDKLSDMQDNTNSYVGVARDELVSNWNKNNPQVETNLATYAQQQITSTMTVAQDVNKLPGDVSRMIAFNLMGPLLGGLSSGKLDTTQVETTGKTVIDTFIKQLGSTDLKTALDTHGGSSQSYVMKAQTMVGKTIVKIADIVINQN